MVGLSFEIFAPCFAPETIDSAGPVRALLLALCSTGGNTVVSVFLSGSLLIGESVVSVLAAANKGRFRRLLID